MVDARADDDHRLAVCRFGVPCELTSKTSDGVSSDARQILLPCGSVGSDIVVAGRIFTGKAATHAELGHQEIERCRDDNRAVGGLHSLYRHASQRDLAFDELVVVHHDDLIIVFEERQDGVDRGVVQPVFHLQVPLAHLFAPAIPDGALGHTRFARGLVEHR